MRKKIGALSLLVVAATTAYAQQSEEGLTGKASLGYIATSGNSETSSANAAFQLLFTREVWSHQFDVHAIGASTDGDTTTETYDANYIGRRALGERGYLFGALDWQKSRFSTYEQRLAESVGYGRHFVATERHKLDAEFGLGARQVDLIDGTSDEDAILRTKVDYAWTISETTTFGQQFTVESGDSNTHTESLTELRARLFGDFALVLSYRIRHDSDVLPGTDKTDTFTALSLEYAF